MSKKKVIVIITAIFGAIIMVLLINHNANGKYAALSKTITAYKAVSYLPQRTTLDSTDIKAVQVPVSMAAGLATGNVAGKALVTSLMPGDLIFSNELGNGSVLPPGTVSISVPVNQSTADNVTAGDRVDIYGIDQNSGQTVLIASGVKVACAYDSQNNPITPARSSGLSALQSISSKTPAVVELYAPAAKTLSIIQYAKNIYLVRVK